MCNKCHNNESSRISTIEYNLSKVNILLFNLDNICQVIIEIVGQNSFKLSRSVK